MSVGPDEVRRIAKLARLRFSEEEAETLGRDLNDILAYVDTLASAPGDETSVGDSPRAAAPERAPGVRKADSLVEPPGHYAPDFREGFFVVPSPPSLSTEGAPPSRS